MWIKFSILMLVAVLNISLGLIILLKNKNKDKSKLFFSLMCFSAACWAAGIGLTRVIFNEFIFWIVVKFVYISATIIFVSFFMFCINFLYKIKKVSNFFKIFISLFTAFIFYIILSGKLFIGLYKYQSNLFEREHGGLLLVYGLYFFILLVYSYCLLFLKHKNSHGINQLRLVIVIIGTFIPFVLGIWFAWYMPYINKHYLDWMGPVFVFFMTFSISYLFFKKN